MDPLSSAIPRVLPALDSDFRPASLWERRYRESVARRSTRHPLSIACLRPDGSGSVVRSEVCVSSPKDLAAACLHAERRVKFLLWARGGSRIMVQGPEEVVRRLQSVYALDGARAFDHGFFAQVYDEPVCISACTLGEMPSPTESGVMRGRHLDGCRIGFDLGGSDRKCAAVIDGEVVFSTEVVWDPYFQSDPDYHLAGIEDVLALAAAHLPRVDAIGGSAAGIYVDNAVCVSSLFRGIPRDLFEVRVRPMFLRLREKWDVPFEVANDGDVTALAGSMSSGRNGILGVALGTSLAAGYVTPSGGLTPWLSELAFAPIDYRNDAPADEWSGDHGCGVQYLSQQAVARLAQAAGICFDGEPTAAERLAHVQELLARDDERAARVFEAIGVYLGYAIPHWADFYEFENLLILGRVASGSGGDIIIESARRVLVAEFPDLAGRVSISTLGERDKRHGQAIAAASLPSLHS